MGLKEIGREGVDCIYIAPCWDTWRALVTTVMIISGLLAKEQSAYREKFCSMKSDVCVCVYKGITSIRYALNQYILFHC